ncbi:MAG: hypothetical protein CM1200mP36_00840 [Gammaproteobacteria bacterium]|nr:MAG: hypothetical protein CM1200mP36_00840 [Gammaproteobacteria bacterium]
MVHEEYGIGRFLGVANLEIDSVPTEFLVLEYADADKLYVPVHNLHLGTRYTGHLPTGATPSARFGSMAQGQAQGSCTSRDVAAELLGLYAQRAARRGIAFFPSPRRCISASPGISFQETDDQIKAVQETLEDLLRGQPMDRVIWAMWVSEKPKSHCGLRSSRGKQAIRSVCSSNHAARAATSSNVLRPFRRLADSRRAAIPFRNSKKAREMIEGLSNGTVDIVIGTHRLLSGDIQFKQLGLIVVMRSTASVLGTRSGSKPCVRKSTC